MCVCCIMSFFEFLSYQERQARRTALSPNWERLRKSMESMLGLLHLVCVECGLDDFLHSHESR